MTAPHLEPSFMRLLQRCYDALRSGASQGERDRLRGILKELLTA